MKVEFVKYFLYFIELGFARDKKLLNYYMNGNDAFRLKLWLTCEKPVK